MGGKGCQLGRWKLKCKCLFERAVGISKVKCNDSDGQMHHDHQN